MYIHKLKNETNQSHSQVITFIHVPQLKEDYTVIHLRNLKIQQSLKLNLSDLMSTRKTKRCWEEKAPLDITKLIL